MPTKKRHMTGSPDGAVSPEKRQNLLSDPRNINITRPYDPPLLPSNHALSNAMLHQSRANYVLRAGPRPNRRSTEEEDAAYHFREREFVEREVAEREALHKTSLQERADKTQKKAVEKFRVGAERRKKPAKKNMRKPRRRRSRLGKKQSTQSLLLQPSGVKKMKTAEQNCAKILAQTIVIFSKFTGYSL